MKLRESARENIIWMLLKPLEAAEHRIDSAMTQIRGGGKSQLDVKLFRWDICFGPSHLPIYLFLYIHADPAKVPQIAEGAPQGSGAVAKTALRAAGQSAVAEIGKSSARAFE